MAIYLDYIHSLHDMEEWLSETSREPVVAGANHDEEATAPVNGTTRCDGVDPRPPRTG